MLIMNNSVILPAKMDDYTDFIKKRLYRFIVTLQSVRILKLFLIGNNVLNFYLFGKVIITSFVSGT